MELQIQVVKHTCGILEIFCPSMSHSPVDHRKWRDLGNKEIISSSLKKYIEKAYNYNAV